MPQSTKNSTTRDVISHPADVQTKSDSTSTFNNSEHCSTQPKGISMKSHKNQKQNSKVKSLNSSWASLGMKAISVAGLSYLANKGHESLIPGVQAVDHDGVNLESFEIDSGMDNMLWCGKENESILVQTQKGTVYRSKDHGETWKKMHSIMSQTGGKVLDQDQTDIGKVRKMIQSPVDDSMIVFTGTKGINWVTEDCGANIRALNSGNRIHEFKFHPTQKQWALAAGWTECVDQHDEEEPCEIVKELFVTQDMGVNWKYLKNYIFDFEWGTTTFSATLPGKTNETRIFFTHDPKMKGHQRSRQKWMQHVHLFYSDDWLKTMKQQLDAGNTLIMTNHYMFVGKAISKSQVKVYTSRAEEGFLNFRQAVLPSSFHVTDNFVVLDTEQKSVFLYVNDMAYSEPIGQLFISDGLGQRFTHSMENIVKGSGHLDFDAIESMDGTFIANRYDDDHNTEVEELNMNPAGNLEPITEEMIEEVEAEKEEHSRMKTSGKKAKASSTRQHSKIDDFHDKQKTYISHNRGADWQLIKPPATNMKGKASKCQIDDGCSLHFQMHASGLEIAPPYSTETALGLMLAVGSLGKKLDMDRGSRQSTFLSRDGGVNWAEIASIPLIYDMGDHGSLLVAAANMKPTQEIKYSWNEGKTWTSMHVSDDPIWVENIITEPKSTSQKFILYGRYDNTSEIAVDRLAANEGEFDVDQMYGKDVMIQLDFSGLHERTCKGGDSAGKEDSDFELWSPHDDGRHGNQDKCFLGQKVTYARRKQDAECFNDDSFERMVERVPCSCSKADYECDINYVPNKAGDCVKAKSANDKELEKEECSIEGHYYQSRGYRKIPGNACKGGVELDPIKKSCTAFTSLTSFVGEKQKFLAAALVVVAIYFGWPIIEAIIIALPIPDPKSGIDNVINAASDASEMVTGTRLNTGAGPGQQTSDYSQNLDAQVDGFLEENDSSDDDVGKDAINLGLGGSNNDDPEANKGSSNELIDLGGGSSSNDQNTRKAAQNIPKLSGPN